MYVCIFVCDRDTYKNSQRQSNRVVMTPYHSTPAIGRCGWKEGGKSHCEVSHGAQGCPRARVQLTDKAFDSDTLLCDDNKND